MGPASVTVIGFESMGTNWMVKNRAPHAIENDDAPRGAVGIWPRDIGIVTDIAGEAGSPQPVTAADTRFHPGGAGLKLSGDP